MKKIFFGIPILNESNNIRQLLNCISDQNIKNIETIFCVNQPELWWNLHDKIKQCFDNQKSIAILKEEKRFPVHIIDKSSKGKGWNQKNKGVGWARKLIFEKIIELSSDKNDIIISMDADTTFKLNYANSVKNIFSNKDYLALCNPYYHFLSDNEQTNRKMLRYEIFMRYYELNLLKIQSPYAFTALGSAISFPVSTYQKIKGIKPRESGEDFYLMQKIIKTGKICFYNDEMVFPSGRISNRVGFGTGPAIAKTLQEQAISYPFYSLNSFKKIEETYNLFNTLYLKNTPTPMDDFFIHQFGNLDFWNLLRKNSTKKEAFIHACHTKIDGLRILQFLKWDYQEINNNEENLIEFLCMINNKNLSKEDLTLLKFDTSPIESINKIRNILFDEINKIRKNNLL